MNKKRVLTNTIVLIIFGFAIWGVSLLRPIIIDEPDIIEPCTHEIMQSEVDSKLMTMYVPVLIFVERQVPNQMMMIDYCAECNLMFVNDSTVYTYSELFDKVAP